MLQKTVIYIKKYPLSLLTFLAILYLSLFKPSGETDIMLFANMDKVAHFIMYAGLSFIIWCEFFKTHRRTKKWKKILALFFIPALFSGVMEICQSELTEHRTGDIWDFIFNLLGILFSNIVCLFLLRPLLDRTSRRGTNG